VKSSFRNGSPKKITAKALGDTLGPGLCQAAALQGRMVPRLRVEHPWGFDENGALEHHHAING